MDKMTFGMNLTRLLLIIKIIITDIGFGFLGHYQRVTGYKSQAKIL